MLIYLAGPITASNGRTVEEHVASAAAIYLRLIDAGVWAFCTHLSALVPAAFDVHYERWMEYDLFMLARCDAVLMLPNWEQSSGARREHLRAEILGKTIYYNVEDLLR